MMIQHNPNPPAIVSSVSGASYANAFSPILSADIQAVQTWIGREQELTAIRKFRENWDGYGSVAPSPAVMDRADLFLRTMKHRNYTNPPMRMALSPSGFLMVEWIEGSAYVRAEIQDSDDIEWVVAIPGQPTRFMSEKLLNRTPGSAEQEQVWQPTPVVEDERAFALAV